MRTDWSQARMANQQLSPASFLMVDWTGALVTVTEVTRQPTSLQVGRTFKQTIQADDDHGQAAITSWLTQLIKRERLASRTAIVCAPRRFVAFKLLTLPAVNDSRLAEAVHLQCETLFPVAAEELVIDFVAQAAVDGQTERSVLVAAIPCQQIQLIQDCMADAELECHAIIVPELALARNEVTAEVDAEAIILLGPSKIEYTIRLRSMPIVCYAAKPPASTNMPAEITSTLRRLLASLPPSVLTRPISSIRFLETRQSTGQEEAALRQPAWVDQLRRELLMKVSYRIVKREDEMKAESLLAALSDSQCRINFASPRKPIDHRRLAIRQRIKIACAIAATVLLAWSLARFNTLRLESQITRLQQQRVELEKQIEKEQPRWQQVALVAHWQDKQFNYSRLLSDYINTLPGSEELMLTRVEVNQDAEGLGELNVEGFGKTSQSVNNLVNQLIKNPQYSKTQLKRLEARQGDNRYGAEFAITVALTGGEHYVEN